MTDNNSLFEGEVTAKSLRERIAWDMARGFGAAGAVVIGVGVVIWVFYLFGTLLPAESKEADDPSYGWQIERGLTDDPTRIT